MSALDEMNSALNRLFTDVNESIGKDVGEKVKAAIAEKDERIAELEKEATNLAEQLAFQRTLEGKVIVLDQRLAEARRLIQSFMEFSFFDTSAKRGKCFSDARNWLKGNP